MRPLNRLTRPYGMQSGMRSAEVIEYFGMPGVGKTWMLAHSEGWNTHIVPTGRDPDKGLNTMRGMVAHPGLLICLVRTAWANRMVPRRPMWVIFERLGRCMKLAIDSPGDVVHIDEGALQFIWRFFCDVPVTPHNRRLLRRCVDSLDLQGRRVMYVWCPPGVHRERVKARAKAQSFDTSLLQGDAGYVRRCRAWMGCLLRALRSAGSGLSVVRAGAASE